MSANMKPFLDVTVTNDGRIDTRTSTSDATPMTDEFFFLFGSDNLIETGSLVIKYEILLLERNIAVSGRITAPRGFPASLLPDGHHVHITAASHFNGTRTCRRRLSAAGSVGCRTEKMSQLSPKVVSRVMATCADETVLSGK